MAKGIKTPAYSDAELDSMASGMAAVFGDMPKKTVCVPRDPLNHDESGITVSVNGYTFVIKRGVNVRVPDEVAKILKRANYI